MVVLTTRDTSELNNERTELLIASQRASYETDDEELLSPSSSSATLCAEVNRPSKFPWRQVIIILMLTAVQPLAYELVFPFINQMILEIGVVDDPERVGFYSGVIESLFAVMSFIFVIPCSFISDKYGRRPVVLLSMLVLAISTALFGFSKSYWFMIATRIMGGVSAASWSTMKVMLGELTDKSNQGKAFAAFTASYKIGQIVGQPIGGLLSHPERRFDIFDNEFWKTYPYAFPCLFSASFAFLAVIAGSFTLVETKPRTKKGRQGSYGSVVSDDVEALSMNCKPTASWSSILTPHVTSVLTSLFAMSLASEVLFALYPLFAFTPVRYGGLGCNEAAIGTHMAARSFVCILMMMCLFAPLQSRIGTRRTYQITMLTWPLTILFFPILNLLKRWEASELVMNIALFAFFVVWGLAHISWPASSVLINDATPSADALAAMNGISQMAIVLPQAIAPAFVTSMFAWSITSHILGGYLIWIILFGIVILASMQCLTLSEPTHDWREDLKNQHSESE